MKENMYRVWHMTRQEMLGDVPIWNNDLVVLTRHDDGEFFEVDWDTDSDVVVMQYIGMRDHHHIRLYEDDILQYISADRSVELLLRVVFHKGEFVQEKIPNKLKIKDPDATRQLWYDWDEVVLVGNKWENPELCNEKVPQPPKATSPTSMDVTVDHIDGSCNWTVLDLITHLLPVIQRIDRRLNVVEAVHAADRESSDTRIQDDEDAEQFSNEQDNYLAEV